MKIIKSLVVVSKMQPFAKSCQRCLQKAPFQRYLSQDNALIRLWFVYIKFRICSKNIQKILGNPKLTKVRRSVTCFKCVCFTVFHNNYGQVVFFRVTVDQQFLQVYQQFLSSALLNLKTSPGETSGKEISLKPTSATK